MNFQSAGDVAKEIRKSAHIAKRGGYRTVLVTAAGCALLMAITINRGNWLMTAAVLICSGIVAAVLLARARNNWLCAVDERRLLVRAVAAPIFPWNTRKPSLPSVVEICKNDILAASSLHLEIKTTATTIRIELLLLELSLQEYATWVAFAKDLQARRMRERHPAYFELRPYEGRLVLRWDNVKPSLAEFLLYVKPQTIGSGEAPKIVKDTIDLRDLSTQPEEQRRMKVRCLNGLGLGPLAMRLLTENRGMSFREAASYFAKACAGEPVTESGAPPLTEP